MMILAFFVGSILSLVGRIGGDAMELVSYTLSEENLNNDRDPFLIGQAEDVKKYLKICLHGNGSLESEFDLGDSLQRIEDIDEVLNGLSNVTQQFNNIRSNLPAFKTLEEQIKNRTEYRTDEFALLDTSDPENIEKAIPLKRALQFLNEAIGQDENKKERWGINGDTLKTCVDGPDGFSEGEFTFHPKFCKPIDRDWISSISLPGGQTIKDFATIVSEIVDKVSKLDPDKGSFIGLKNGLKTRYDNYLNSYIEMIDFLNTTISSLIGEIKSIAGDGQIFSFVNGKFIGTNIKIILKYLKYSLGQDLYTVGLCLDIVGLSLILSISSTILLIAIINTLLKNMQQPTPPDGVIPYQNNVPRQISVQNY